MDDQQVPNKEQAGSGQAWPDLQNKFIAVSGPVTIGPGNEVLPVLGEVKFKMIVSSHFFLTKELEREVHFDRYPTWPVTRSVILQVGNGIYELNFWFEKSSINERKPEEWLVFSQQVAAALSYCACVPVVVQMSGEVTTCLEPLKYSLTRLEPNHLAGGEMPLPGTRPVMAAINPTDDHHSLCLFFFHHALGQRDPLYRFINLVICYEIWMGVVSTIDRSRAPICLRCNWTLLSCPGCEKPWGRIPTPLAAHLHEVLQDEELEANFIKYRNVAFHPTVERLSSNLRQELIPINLNLITHFRNSTRDWYGLPRVDRLSESLFPPETSTTVFFTMPGAQAT